MESIWERFFLVQHCKWKPRNHGGELGSVGAYGWSGAWNTRFLIDPREQMFVIVMTQLQPYAAVDVMDKFTMMVYQALVD